jgi:hypothetical protein
MNPKLFTALAAVIGIVFVGLCVWASLDKNLFEGFGVVLAEPWGVVAIADLYIGFLFVAVWIAVVERNKALAPLWIVALLILGNIVTIVYVILRAIKADSLRDVFLPAAVPK